MNKKYLLLTVFLVAVFATLNVTKVNSKITSPPAGNSNDPSSAQTCARSGCHPSPAQSPPTGDLTLTIGTGNPTTPLSGFTFTPGTLYNLAFSFPAIVGATHPFYGFQIVALDAANAKAGTMAVTNSATTQINTSGTKQYMGHKSANSTHNWAFKWTAPASCGGPVTFYYAYNKCDASATNPSGAEGTIYNGSTTINCSGTGIADIASLISELNIFPNPISNDFSLSFNLNEANTVSAQLYNLNGELVRELINEKTEVGHIMQTTDVQALPAGIYLVKLNVGESSITKKIIKQ